MRLYERDRSPYWWYEFCIDGKIYRGSTKRKLNDRKGANAVLSNLYTIAADKNQLGVKAEITLQECFDLTLNEVSGSSHRGYRASYNALYDSGLATPTKPLSSLSQDDIEDFVEYRRSENKADNTIKGDLKAIARALNKVSKRYKVQEIEWPKIKTYSKSRYLTDEEEALIYAKLEERGNISAAKASDLCVLLVDTGVRLMEGVELEWMDIDMTSRAIEVYRPKTKTITVVPMSQRVHDMLQRRHNQAKPFEQPFEAIKVLRDVIANNCNTSRRVVETKGRATVHTLRDTFASRMVQRGLSIQKLSKLLGHSTIQQTMKYAHLEKTDVLDEARNLLDQV